MNAGTMKAEFRTLDDSNNLEDGTRSTLTTSTT